MSESKQNIDNQDITEVLASGGDNAVPKNLSPDGPDVVSEDEPEEELEPLEAALRDASNWRDVALRSKAELDNFRKRMARERSDAIRYANLDLLETLLPVLDNFEFGLQAAKAEEGSSIYFGMQMVLLNILWRELTL